MPLLSPSGGIVYHLRAARFRARQWAPFRERLAAWLDEQLGAAPELVLVGPNAGHCLPLSVLARYPQLTALEPEWLAARLLRLRLPRVEVVTRDLLVGPLLDGSPGLDEYLAQKPDAAVLFCNVLGQLQFGLDDAQQARLETEFRRRLLPALAGRQWASFHDRWSFDLGHDAGRPLELGFARKPSDSELGQAWFGSEGPPLSALDHGTAELFPPELPRRYLGWQLTPSAFHLVEAVASTSRA
jgi:hypothetical protein